MGTCSPPTAEMTTAALRCSVSVTAGVPSVSLPRIGEVLDIDRVTPGYRSRVISYDCEKTSQVHSTTFVLNWI